MQSTLLFLAALLGSLYPFQMYFEGYLIGDPFDTRLMINQHEHWFRLITGESSLRDTYTFYPFDKALGLTDAFLIPGLTHSFFRALGFSVVDSWSIATFLFFLLGNLGWIWVAKLILKKKLVQIFFVLTISSTPTLALLLERAPNATGYPILSWLLLFTLLGLKQLINYKPTHGFGIVLIILPALMTSSWYPGFFYILTLFVSLFVFVLFNYQLTLKVIREKLEYFKSFSVLKYYFLVATPLFSLWAYIHLPVASKQNRNWPETIGNSSYISQTLNQEYLNNGWYFIFIKNFNYDAFQKSDFAIPAILLIATAVFLFFSYFVKIQQINLYRNFLLFPGIIITVIFTRITDDFSLFKIFWENIPGFYSIRFPYRYIIVLSFILLIFIYVFIDQVICKYQASKIITAPLHLLLIVLIIDLYKPPLTLWAKENYVPAKLAAQQNQIRNNCDFFIVDRPGGWWDDQISAMALSTLTKKPTANGYSGGFPSGYPTKAWNYEGDISEILDWSGFGINDQIGCLVSDSHELINSNPSGLKLLTHSGFSPLDKDDKGNFWHWAEQPEGFFITSVPKTIKKYEIKIELKAAQCLTALRLKIYELPNNLIFNNIIEPKNREVTFVVENTEQTLKQFKFETEEKFCNFENDPRNLYFEMKNFTITPLG